MCRSLQAKALAGSRNGGFTDAEASSDLGFGKPLEEPASDEVFLSFVEYARSPRRRLVHQAIEAELLVAPLPAALGGDGVAKGTSQFLLSSQLALPEHDTDKAKVWQVVEGNPIDRLVAAENDTVAVVIDKPQTGGDKNAGVGCWIHGERQHRLIVGCTHTH